MIRALKNNNNLKKYYLTIVASKGLSGKLLQFRFWVAFFYQLVVLLFIRKFEFLSTVLPNTSNVSFPKLDWLNFLENLKGKENEKNCLVSYLWCCSNLHGVHGMAASVYKLFQIGEIWHIHRKQSMAYLTKWKQYMWKRGFRLKVYCILIDL